MQKMDCEDDLKDAMKENKTTDKTVVLAEEPSKPCDNEISFSPTDLSRASLKDASDLNKESGVGSDTVACKLSSEDGSDIADTSIVTSGFPMETVSNDSMEENTTTGDTINLAQESSKLGDHEISFSPTDLSRAALKDANDLNEESEVCSDTVACKLSSEDGSDIADTSIVTSGHTKETDAMEKNKIIDDTLILAQESSKLSDHEISLSPTVLSRAALKDASDQNKESVVGSDTVPCKVSSEDGSDSGNASIATSGLPKETNDFSISADPSTGVTDVSVSISGNLSSNSDSNNAIQTEILKGQDSSVKEPSCILLSDSDKISVFDEIAAEITSKKNSLPYFQMPNPDLEEYLTETNKNMQSRMENRKSNSSKPQLLNVDVIVLSDDDSPLEKRDYSKDSPASTFKKSNNPQPQHEDVIVLIDDDPLEKHEYASDSPAATFKNVYKAKYTNWESTNVPKVQSAALETHRAIFRNQLKQKIEAEKAKAFKRSKLASKLHSATASKLDVEEILLEESSDDSSEAETVSLKAHHKSDFEFLREKNDSEKDEAGNMSDSSEITEKLGITDSESDEDIFRKTKKAKVLDDSSDSDSIITIDLPHKTIKESHQMEDTSETTTELQGGHQDPELDRTYRKFLAQISGDFVERMGLSKGDPANFDLAQDISKDDVSQLKSCIPTSQNLEDFVENICLPSQSKGIEEGLSQTSASYGAETQSSLPSYQPGGGFVNDSLDQFSAHGDPTPDPVNVENPNNPPDTRFSDLSESPSCSKIPQLFTDEPPSQSEKMTDMFSTQDVAVVCSGAFKSKLSEETHSPEHMDCSSGNDGNQVATDEEHVNQKNYPDMDGEKALPETISEFFDAEAELSGEDDGFDDPENDAHESDYDLVVSDDELPQSEELRKEIADLHMKRLFDDDAELIQDIKEQFLEEGELEGEKRTRRFAWKNNDMPDFLPHKDSSSESENEEGHNTWSAMSQEKAKWMQENSEKEFCDSSIEKELSEPCSSSSKKKYKVSIIGKPALSSDDKGASKGLSCKRPRGSFMNLDDLSATQVIKKLKMTEDANGGSRTTKHFVFLNEKGEGPSCMKDPITSDDVSSTSSGEGTKSVFSRIK